jgi:hypothetical protein
MDLLDRINALTDEQLQIVSERDDASGVLASYRLAELRGLPMPDREAIITGDGYAIVAQAGVISRIKTEGVQKIIREESGEYCVYSEDGSRSFGCYLTMEDAQERLQQIHFFELEKAVREGSFVEWNSSGGMARGQVERITREGSIKVPGIDFTVNAEPDDPAALIRVWRKTSEGWTETDTLVGHKMSTLTQIESLMKESFTPPKGVQEEGQRALDWIAEDHAGSGFTDVGRARAAQLARGDNLSEETVRRMANFLSRHEGDKDAEGFKPGENGYPSPGRVAWAAWGGDPGKTWADSIVERLNRESEKAVCPIATQNVTVNLMRRKTAVEVADYGPLNPAEPNDEFWDHMGEYFDTTGEDARNSTCGNCAAFDMTSDIQDCIAEGITGDTPDGEPDPYDVIEAGDLGYCRVFKFKCASARTCSAWISGGPITDEVEEQKELAKAAFLKRQHEQQFTLGPLYVPDFVDAHGEWTDSEELQTAVWGWVRSGDRRIFLQHDREIVAGEWVEVMTMPQEWTVNMHDPQGNPIGQVTYPPNTVFLGVIWNDESWELIKRGELRGYSIGGFSDRVFADLPEKAARDGLDMPRSEPVDLAKSIATAVAEAMRTNQPIVNVVMSDERKARVRRIERDEHGNISRIVEEEEG